MNSLSIVCIATIFSISMIIVDVSEATSFSIDLIHRDSLQSPSYDSSLTTLERVSNSLQRSFIRAKTFSRDDDSLQSSSADIVPDKGEYLMRFSLGTPPVETLAVADTGSDLIWIQCKPCDQCFHQNAPFFDPSHSSTYKPISCNSNPCNSLPRTSCDGSDKTCGYTVSYGDSSYSKGYLASETIMLGSTTNEKVSIPNVTMGCGHLDQGTFGDDASGIVGLGGGKVSLITQMGSSIQGKFSYCLVPNINESSKPSKMNLGNNAVVSGAGVTSTPIAPKTPDTFYFLTLQGMTVGNQRLDVYSPFNFSSSSLNDSKAFGDGNIIIDSGTTLTFLPSVLYYKVVSQVRRQMKLKQIEDPLRLLDLCFESEGYNAEIPVITAHFKGGDVKLESINTFVKTAETSLCLAFAPATTIAIYGNLAQMNFLVGYDLEKKTVSFKPTDCSKE